MDIGEQERVIVVAPLPVELPGTERPEPAAPAEVPRGAPGGR